jgi:hypothetical protein
MNSRACFPFFYARNVVAPQPQFSLFFLTFYRSDKSLQFICFSRPEKTEEKEAREVASKKKRLQKGALLTRQ